MDNCLLVARSVLGPGWIGVVHAGERVECRPGELARWYLRAQPPGVSRVHVACNDVNEPRFIRVGARGADLAFFAGCASRRRAASRRRCRHGKAELFDFHGLGVQVEGDADAVSEVRRDFSWFSRPAVTADVRSQLHREAAQFKGLPAIPAAFSTPRNFCFRDGAVSYIDYFGRGLAVHDREAGTCVATASELDLLHEMAFLFILSTVDNTSTASASIPCMRSV